MPALSFKPFAIGTARGPDAPWRASIDDGNAALARGDAGTALSSYRMALEEAERLLVRARDETAALLLAPMTLTISLSNMAELRRRAGDPDGAFKLKWRAVDRLMAIADDRGQPTALRLNCVRHLKYALVFLAEDAACDASRRAELAALTSEARSVARTMLGRLRDSGGPADGSTPPSVRPARH